MTRTASSVGMSEANAPKHLKSGSVEGLRIERFDLGRGSWPEWHVLDGEELLGVFGFLKDAMKFRAEAPLSLTLEGEG